MINKYERGLNCSSLNLLCNGRRIKPQTEFVLKTLGVQEIIRIPIKDYPTEFQPKVVLTHFGLPVHDSKVGRLVALSKLVEHGYFYAQGPEKLPLLSLDDVWIARITRVIESTSYEDLPVGCFTSPIGKVHNVQELKALIFERYHQSLPSSSSEEIFSQGVSVRDLELVEKASYAYK
jgi:hypothetical protein